jgi:hypothetical protein
LSWFETSQVARTLEAAIQDLLIATVQNLRKLVKYQCQTDSELPYLCAESLRQLSRLILEHLSVLSPI